MRWSESITLEFVKLYRKYECLWNPEDPGYKHNQAREETMKALAGQFHGSTGIALSITEIRKKIHSLKTTYSNEVSKITDKSTPGKVYKPSIVWFKEMDKCMKHVSKCRQAKEHNNASSSNQVWMKHEFDPEKSDTSPSTTSSNQSDSEVSIKKDRQRKKRKIKKKKRKHKPVLPDSNSEHISRSFKTLYPAQEDEFDIYGKYVESQLRQLDLKNALRLQLEIQNMLSNARTLDLNL